MSADDLDWSSIGERPPTWTDNGRRIEAEVAGVVLTGLLRADDVLYADDGEEWPIWSVYDPADTFRLADFNDVERYRFLPDGVVGYGPGGKPVYDGEWFDRQMAKLGPSITVTIKGGEAIRDRLDSIPEQVRKAVRDAVKDLTYQKGQKR